MGGGSTGKWDQHHSSLVKGKDILKKSVTTVHLLETHTKNYFSDMKYW